MKETRTGSQCHARLWALGQVCGRETSQSCCVSRDSMRVFILSEVKSGLEV